MLYIMPKNSMILLPAVQRKLETLGGNIRLARLRRGLSSAMVAERAGISRQTLSSLENGAGSVSMSTWVQVLFVLGLEKDLEMVGRDDELGRILQDAKLPTRKRARKDQGSALGDSILRGLVPEGLASEGSVLNGAGRGGEA